MCQRIGSLPISTIGFGFETVSSDSRLPNPPARINVRTGRWYPAPTRVRLIARHSTSYVVPARNRLDPEVLVSGCRASIIGARTHLTRLNGNIGDHQREGRSVLRRPGAAPAGPLGAAAKAHGHGRLPTDPVARDALLRALRPQGVHPLPGLQGRRHQGLLPPLRGDALERLRALRRGRRPSSCSSATSPTGGSPSSRPA